MKLSTHYVEKIWGRDDLPDVFDRAGNVRIGEVWFDAADQPLPLLIKWLFTSEKLSIQVHPNDEQAHAAGYASGKEEMWFIVSAEPDARLGMGTLRALNDTALREAAISGEIEELMDWKPVKAGDFYYIPAGTVHAIGAGITLIEVQQNADITYRLYDYGRPRELHLDHGVAVSNATPYADPRSGSVVPGQSRQLVAGPYFELWYAAGQDVADLLNTSGKRWIIPLAGSITANSEAAKAGECLLVEATHTVIVSEDAIALVACEWKNVSV